MTICDQKAKIRAAYKRGRLRVRSVSPEGFVEWKRVEGAIRNEVPWERIFEHRTQFGPMVSTGGHSVYVNPTKTVCSENLEKGTEVLSVFDGEKVPLPILAVKQVEARQFMYDLTVSDHHNFVLHRSKVVVHNCPDRHYHFSPPEHEAQIGQYNRVFGFVWEDVELYTYLQCALDWWNMYPPNTASMACSIDHLLQNAFTRSWRTAIIWGAIWHAMFALARNWAQDEFSIGGEVKVTVLLPDGREVSVPVEELYEICRGAPE